MNQINLNNQSSFASRSVDSILSVFNSSNKNIALIDKDMSNEEISEIISDKLISVIKSQFDETEKKLSTSPVKDVTTE